MMYAIGWILRRIKARINHVDFNMLEMQRDIYRERIKKSELMKHCSFKEFIILSDIATYTDFGIWTAIQAAYCIGYKAAMKGGAV